MRIAICDDDNEMLGRLKKDVIEIFGILKVNIEIFSFSDGKELLRTIQNDDENFDLFLLDIDMPDVSGLEIAQMLREMSVNLIIIFISAYDNYVFDSIEYSPFRYIRKSRIKEELPLAELNTSTDITIKLDTKKSERISEIMDSLKSIEVKSVKYPTFRCDTCITIKMKDGTEHSLGFGSEDMVFDGKYYKPDDNYKEIWNQWAFEYHNEDTIVSNTDDTMESTGYLSDEVQREYVKVNDILYCYSGKTSESLEQIEAKGFVLVGKVALCDNEKIPEINFTAAQIEKGTVIYANENEKDYIYLEIDGKLLVFEEEK